jgi:hypothetical protein
MLRVPKKVADRLRSELLRDQQIATSHRRVSEADTVTVIRGHAI